MVNFHLITQSYFEVYDTMVDFAPDLIDNCMSVKYQIHKKEKQIKLNALEKSLNSFYSIQSDMMAR